MTGRTGSRTFGLSRSWYLWHAQPPAREAGIDRSRDRASRCRPRDGRDRPLRARIAARSEAVRAGSERRLRTAAVVLLGLSAGVAVSVWAMFTSMVGKPVDAWCFYGPDPAAPYWRTAYAFLYSPAAAQAMIPAHAVSFEVFVALLRGAEVLALFALTGPFLPIVVFWAPVTTEINAANINLLIVAVAVWGLRWPALWSFVLLTKVTPGVGIVWFAVRREWRNLGIALGVTGAIAWPRSSTRRRCGPTGSPSSGRSIRVTASRSGPASSRRPPSWPGAPGPTDPGSWSWR